MIEKGNYRGRVVDYGIFKSTAGQQHETVFVDFEVTSKYDPATGQQTPCPAGTAKYTKAITENTIKWVIADLMAIGYDRDGFKYLDPEAPGAVNLFGREIDLVCDHESYGGKTYEKWSIYQQPSRKKVGRDQLDRLDARYADELRRAFGKSAAGPAATTPDPTNDDPF